MILSLPTFLQYQYWKFSVFEFQLQALETKLQSEVGNLYDRIEKTQSEITIYENLDALKDEAEQKRTELLEKKQRYLEVQDAMKDELKIVRQKYEQIQVTNTTSCYLNIVLFG